MGICSCICQSGHAETIRIQLGSGTGFFVSQFGDILTNAHVVTGCQRIMALGAVREQEAQIVAVDEGNDLALVRIEGDNSDVATFRDADREIIVGERVVVVGYPGKSAYALKPVTREAKVLSAKGPSGEAQWFQVDDVIDQGNSGGPLLDNSGQVIGVVAAKAKMYRYNRDAPNDGEYSHAAIAISAATARAFLNGHGVRLREGNAEAYLSADRITDYAERYLVNIRCEKGREVVR